jgi:glycosyltransferase involved in cell wall biosynthesis
VLRAYGLDAKVCYLGVDGGRFRPSSAEKERFVVGLGGAYFGKGVHRAIHALATVPGSERPPLVWIGNFLHRRYARDMERLAAENGVRLEWKINLPEAEMVSLLSRAAALLYTPLLEPFGLAPLEAAACGTPVVAIAEGGVRETVVDGVSGTLVPDDDSVALGRAVAALTGDLSQSRRQGVAARAHVLDRWTWDAAIDRLEAHLHAALQA